jgi:hypothetical protein
MEQRATQRASVSVLLAVIMLSLTPKHPFTSPAQFIQPIVWAVSNMFDVLGRAVSFGAVVAVLFFVVAIALQFKRWVGTPPPNAKPQKNVATPGRKKRRNTGASEPRTPSPDTPAAGKPPRNIPPVNPLSDRHPSHEPAGWALSTSSSGRWR